MSLNKPITALIAAIAGLVVLTGAAMASPAAAVTALNVRSGPGVGFHVVDVLHTGERVNVETCRRNGWCFVTHRGRDGWVSSNYLRHTGYRKQYRSYPRHTPRYRRGDDFEFRFGGPNFNFSFGTNHQHDCFRRYGRLICR